MAADIEEVVEKHALLNAIKHEGKAEVKPVVGKILAERPELRSRVREIIKLVETVVAKVNKLGLSEQRRVVEEKWPYLLYPEKTPEEKRLPPLPNIGKYRQIVTRFSPNPDCVLHIGNARALILSHEYAKMYNGKFILRFEDTDPKLKRPKLEFYRSIEEDMIWLNCKWDEKYIQSDRLPVYYEYARKLLEKNAAYVCTCAPQKFREHVSNKLPCPCRNLPTEEQLERWDNMLNGVFQEGEVVVRIKTDLQHPNPAVRDWPALRIIDTDKYPHPRVGSKYKVWPLYNFACGIDDYLMGVTHIIRGKEHLTNEVRQRFMYAHLGWEYPETFHYGRLKIENTILSKSEIKQAVASGELTGFDDPRLATLAALRRRGISPEAIRRLILEIGPKPTDSTISWENLYAYNRKIIDPVANRYFFVSSPIVMRIRGAKNTYVAKLPMHPDSPERGYRELVLSPRGDILSVYISESDKAVLTSNAVVRLIGLFNVRISSINSAIEAEFHSESYEDAKNMGAKLIQWVPLDSKVKTTILMPDGRKIRGFAESSCVNEKPGVVVQFERFGFVKLEKVHEEGVVGIYAHR